MREYIKQVKRALRVSRAQKREIIRDLTEALASAREHGETEAQVLERLGAPEAFARSMEEQLGVDRNRQRRKLLAGAVFMTVCAAACLGIHAAVRSGSAPANAIGGADAMTSIQIGGALDLSRALPLLAAVALALAVALGVAYLRRR